MIFIVSDCSFLQLSLCVLFWEAIKHSGKSVYFVYVYHSGTFLLIIHFFPKYPHEQQRYTDNCICRSMGGCTDSYPVIQLHRRKCECVSVFKCFVTFGSFLLFKVTCTVKEECGFYVWPQLLTVKTTLMVNSQHTQTHFQLQQWHIFSKKSLINQLYCTLPAQHQQTAKVGDCISNIVQHLGAKETDRYFLKRLVESKTELKERDNWIYIQVGLYLSIVSVQYYIQ